MPRAKRTYDYDLIIIGSGAGGGVAAHIAADKRKKVAIIEDETIGGECPNYGCVPTKALLHAAELYEAVQDAPNYGITTDNVQVNFSKVKSWKDIAVLRTGTVDGEEAFSQSGINVIKGRAHFIDKYTVSVGNQRFSAKKFIIATGTKNFIPPIHGLEEHGFITYREAINLKKPPTSLFVIGGGAIGCEFAQFFATFKTKVTIAEFGPRLIGKEDPELGELVGAVFESHYNIKVLTSTKVTKVTSDRGKKVVHLEREGKTETVRVDEILLATGKIANLDLGLDNAGVRYTSHNIPVNREMQTNVSHIYAAGDVAGPYMFTHMASYQSRIAAHNIFSREKIQANYHAVPRCVFVSPEAAAVGITEDEAREKGIKLKIAAVPTSIIGRANTTNQKTGFVKILATTRGVIVGASIVAPRAGEMIHELTLAVQLGLKAEDVAATIHAFPTWSEAIRIAAAKIDA